jgi:hypothetical protein
MQMIKSAITGIIFSLALVITACKPSAEDIANAISLTQTALPSPTPLPIATVVSLQDIDLSKIMFSNDLPTGFEPGQVSLRL